MEGTAGFRDGCALTAGSRNRGDNVPTSRARQAERPDRELRMAICGRSGGLRAVGGIRRREPRRHGTKHRVLEGSQGGEPLMTPNRTLAPGAWFKEAPWQGTFGQTGLSREDRFLTQRHRFQPCLG